MKFAGEATVHAPVERVWDAMLDPAVLVRTIPGCERLEATGENSYAMTVTAGVAAIKGTYAGTCSLRDLDPHTSLVLAAEGAGAPGTIAADVQVRFRDNGDATTTVSYDADATVGGMIGGVGQRMLGSVSKRMAGEFFSAVDGVLNGTAPSASSSGSFEPSSDPAMPGVYVDAPSSGSPDEFVRGALVGAGLVTLGVVLGSGVGRRC